MSSLEERRKYYQKKRKQTTAASANNETPSTLPTTIETLSTFVETEKPAKVVRKAPIVPKKEKVKKATMMERIIDLFKFDISESDKIKQWRQIKRDFVFLPGQETSLVLEDHLEKTQLLLPRCKEIYKVLFFPCKTFFLTKFRDVSFAIFPTGKKKIERFTCW